jgi:hypothetical protein
MIDLPALAIILLAAATWFLLRWKFRRDDRAVRLAVAVGEERICDLRERRLSLMEADRTPFDEDTVQLPIVTPREQSIPMGFTLFRGGLVHTHCLGPYLRSDARPCAGCAVHLDHVLTGAS